MTENGSEKTTNPKTIQLLHRLMNDGSLEKIGPNKFQIKIKDQQLCTALIGKIMRMESFYKGTLINTSSHSQVIRKLLEKKPLSYDDKKFLYTFVLSLARKDFSKDRDMPYPKIVLPQKPPNPPGTSSENYNLVDAQKSLMICEFFYNKCKCNYDRVSDDFLDKIKREFMTDFPPAIDTKDIQVFFGNTFVFIDKAFSKLKELSMMNLAISSNTFESSDHGSEQLLQSDPTLPDFKTIEANIRADGIEFPELFEYGLHKCRDRFSKNQIIIRSDDAPKLPKERDEDMLTLPYLKALPSQPKIIQATFTPNKVEHPDDYGEIYIAFTTDTDANTQEKIISFEVIAYMICAGKKTYDWEKIGEMKFFDLPMMMKLHHLKKSVTYYFALRAIDARRRAGPYSVPLSLQT